MKSDKATINKFCIIGSGPAGLAVARTFNKAHIDYDVIESHTSEGGIWDISNQPSPMYSSANFISSRDVSSYFDFPFLKSNSEYPKREEVLDYLKRYVKENNIKNNIKFNTKIVSIKKINKNAEESWVVTTGNGKEIMYKGIILASGTQQTPNHPEVKGIQNFKGLCIHSNDYIDSKIFENKRVLIVGFGASAVDISDESGRVSKYTHLSIRNGAYIIPKHMFGVPTDVWANSILPLPSFIKLFLFKKLIHWFNGDLSRFNLPKPEHELFEKPVVITSQLIQNLSHGYLKVKQNIDKIEKNSVMFDNGTSEKYDVIVLCTGYKECWPFVDKKYLKDAHEENLFMNIFSKKHDNLFVAGLLRSNRGGFWMFEIQAEMIACAIKSSKLQKNIFHKLIENHKVDSSEKTDSNYKSRYIEMSLYMKEWRKLKKKMKWNVGWLVK